MTLPFAGLARARARMIGGRLEGEAQKWNQDQEEAQRLFREWATRKQMEQAEEAQRYTRERNTALDAERKADRAATLARQNQTDQLDAIQAGGEDAPEMTTAQLLAGLSMMQGGTGSSAAAIKAPRTSTYKAKVGGVDVQAEDMGGPSYATVGGRMFRFDRQKGANAAARQRAEKEQFNIADDNRRLQQTLQAIGARAGAQQTPTGRRLTANMADNLGTYNALIGTATDALTKLDAATDAKLNVTGAVRGRITGPVGQFFGVGVDPREISARGALANITSSIMKDRSGGAITPQEFVRLEPFLPSKNESEESARQKLVDLIGSLDEIRTARLNALEGSGYDVSGVRPHNNEQPTGTVRKYSPHNPYPHP